MAFYNPMQFSTSVSPMIVYFDEGVEEVLPRSRLDIREHLINIQKTPALREMMKNKEIDYQIAFFWKNCESLMTDEYVFWDLGKWGSGALSEVIVFRELERITGIGSASLDTQSVIGREADHMHYLGNNLEKYLSKRPKIRKDLMLNKDFWIN